MHYFLYFPGRQSLPKEEMESIGLGNIVDGDGPTWSQITGPDEGQGAFATWSPGGRDAPVGLDEMQTWEEHPGSPLADKGAYWFGWYERDRPIAFDLKKAKSFDGLGAILGDEGEWSIPIARYLPHDNCWDVKTGKYSRQIAEAYKDYFEMSEQFVTQFFSQLDQLEELGLQPDDRIGIHEIPMNVTWEYCVRALDMNYRLTSDLIHWMGLLREDTSVLRLIMASTEMPLRVQMLAESGDQKKTDLPEPNRISASVAQFI